ncbi:MAG: tRNA-dihydrouridine synthase family protein [Treponema sp.]|nr:tRNA-dihydrouridine synthase family protein [Treponema sp.]
MAELSHRALRELIEGFGGSAVYYTEMISAGALVCGGPYESWYLDSGPCPERVVYQLVGADPERLAAAAALLDRRECAGIDLNMGCSAPAITRTGAGVRWMSSIERAGELIRLVRRGVKRRLSVKLRIGLEDDMEYLIRFCRRLEEEGVECIALHPRTAREKFKGRSRWDAVALLRAALRVPVVGNGDIADAGELLCRAQGPWDGVMTGRAAVRQPWIFAQARRLPGSEAIRVDLEATGLSFLERLARYQPPEFHLSRSRRFFSYFCDNLIWGNYLKNLLNREGDRAGIERIWRGYFQEHGEERLKTF